MIVSSPTKSLDLFIEHIQRLADEDIVGIKFGVSEVDDYLLPLTETDLAFILARPGNAKCMGRGTKVLMYDGSLKNIEDVVVNDKLMGPDSKPRRVLSTTSGYDEMYWIRQKKGGIDYLVNGNHILSLIRSKNEYDKKHGEIKNISVNDILSGPKSLLNRWKGYKVAVDFPEKEQLLDPYFVVQSVNEISIEYHGVDEYFGFELSGDGLYLLEDMTVTHNTSIMTHYSFRAAELHLESQKNKIKYGPPIFVTAEMPIESLMVRSLSKFSGLDSRFLLTGKGNVDWKLVEKHAKDLTDENPIIYMGNSLYEGKRGPIQLEDIQENIERVVDKIGMPPSLICVDYLQRIVMRKGPADRRLIMSEIVERFKDIATNFRVPILVGSQAGREVDTRTFPVPTTKDGKETGAIEEAADVVLSGFRPIKYWKAGQPVPHSSKGMIVSEELYFLQVLKQRNGEAGSGFWISFDPKVGEFDSLSIL